MGKKYDYLIVGSGLFGSVFAHEATERGKSCLVVERRGHVGGNVYCEKKDDIVLHKYGVHIFHTDNKTVWDYMNRFVGLDDFVLSPLANYRGETYPLPFNLNTFRKLWGIETAEEAAAIIEKQRGEVRGEPRNLEEQAISLVGKDIYEKLIKGYTAKQWGRPCNELPAFIIRRLPVRYTADNSYFNDRYQGVPREGYNALFEKLLGGSEVLLNTDYLLQRESLSRWRERLFIPAQSTAFSTTNSVRWHTGAWTLRPVGWKRNFTSKQPSSTLRTKPFPIRES
jgi:UDP-galactopyranose mutase